MSNHADEVLRHAAMITIEALESDEWGSTVDPAEFLRDDPTFGYGGGPINLSRDRQGGQDYPVFQTEQELAVIRGVGRVIYSATEHGKNALENLSNYILCGGFQWNAKTTEAGKANPNAEAVRARVQWFLDRLLKKNDWTMDRDDESITRACRDGEALLALFDSSDKVPVVRFIEPSQLTEPSQQMQQWLVETYALPELGNWRFGVHTAEGDVETVYGYFVQWTENAADFDYLPAARVVHIKRNVDRNVKRGISDFYPMRRTLPKAIKLGDNMFTGAAIQAAIAWVVELPADTTKGQAATFVSANAGGATKTATPASGSSGGTNAVRSAVNYPAGSIPVMKQGTTYKAGPMGAERNAGFIDVLQAALRTIGIRWQMPEFMISGDASNANYASTIAAATPFGRARVKDQAKFGARWLELMSKALALAVECGLLDDLGVDCKQVEQIVEIAYTAPDVEFQNSGEAVDAALKKRDLGVDASVLLQELGYDPATEMSGGQPGAGLAQPGQANAGGIPGSQPAPGGEMAALSTLQFRRNSKAILEVLNDAATGVKTRVTAKQFLLGLAVPDERAEILLDDVMGDGTVDDAELKQAAKEAGESAVDPEMNKRAAITGLVRQVADGSLPLDSGMGQLQTLYGLTAHEAASVMGSAGQDVNPSDAAVERALEKLWSRQ